MCILVLIFSCGPREKSNEAAMQRDSIALAPTRIVNSIGVTLIPKARKELESWQEYSDMDDYISRYYSTTVMEALSNAEELAQLTQYLRDSIRIEKLKLDNVIARLNVLNNEALRLSDMANIPAISNDEVKEEVAKILELYSAVNAKINTIYSSEALQESLEVDTEVPVELNSEKQVRPTVRPRRTTSSVKKN